ncbi:acyltransferase family protein [Spirosoma lituiforme]
MNRIKEIDVLRGISALAVCSYHYLFRHFEIDAFQEGRLGVQLFFIISGFVIFLTATRVNDPLDFVIARISRLYPAYWACILLTISAYMLVGNTSLPHNFKPITITQVLVNLTMLQKFLKVPAIDVVYWTLAVELLFYGFIFLVLVFGKLKQYHQWCSFLLLVTIAGMLMSNKPTSINYYSRFFPFFVAGIYYYNIYIKGKIELLDGIGVLISYVIACCSQYNFGQNTMPNFLYVTLMFTVFLLISTKRLAYSKYLKIFLWFGQISYPFYLLHTHLGIILMDRLQLVGITNNASRITIAFGTVTALSFVVHKQIEVLFSKRFRTSLAALLAKAHYRTA